MSNKKVIVEPNYKTLKMIFEPDKNYIKEYETLLNSLFGLQFTNDTGINPVFTFGMLSEGAQTTFYINLDEKYEDIFRRKYAAINPYIQFEEMSDPIDKFYDQNEDDHFHYIEGYNMNLIDRTGEKRLKTSDSNNRFMSNIINSMNNLNTDDRSIVEIVISSMQQFNKKDFNKNISEKALNTIGFLINGMGMALDFATGSNMAKNSRGDNKISTKEDGTVYIKNDDKSVTKVDYNLLPKFNTSIRIMSKSLDNIRVFDNIRSMSTAFSDLNDTNSLIPKKMKFENIKKRTSNSNILSTVEISQFLHLPDKSVLSDNIKTSNCKKVYDKNVPSDGAVFGISNNIPVAFPMVPLSPTTYEKLYGELQKLIDNLVKPRLVLGQQGTGKSEWIINYAIILAKFGMSVIAVDPKNDTQQRLIESMPQELMHKVDYINFGDIKYPPSMNMFRKRNVNDSTENSLVVTSFLSLMEKEFARAWGYNIRRLLQMSAEAILLDDTSTLNELQWMLTERVYREYMIQKMKIMYEEATVGRRHIKELIKFWEQFNSKKDEIIFREIEPVMNKIGVFMSNRLIKAIVSQKDGYDFRKAADEGRIVIVNIPEGVLGDNTRLLASMINKAIWLDIQSRANVDISQRYPVAWIIDEAHGLVDNEFVGVLTKARAYRLGLTLVTQGLSNFKMAGMEDMKELILTNCKNKISFRLGSYDAHDFAEELAPLTYTDLANCPDYHFYGKILLENGNVSDPFFAKAPMPATKLRNYDDFLKKHQSGKYTIDEIEDELESRLAPAGVLNSLTAI